MFNLTTETTTRMPRRGAFTVLLSGLLHLNALAAIVILPMLYVTDSLPNVAKMTAFVVAPPPPPPAPPPPAPQPATEPPPKAVAADVNAAPLEAPSRITPEPVGQVVEAPTVPGIEGGVSGGLAGGLVTGLQPPPSPPPAPPAPPQGPVRIGGDIRPPVLVHRVEPVYPEFASSARVEGTVILEAIINQDGAVQSLKVLRSVPLLDKAAIAAVEQWRYSPVMLNGKPVAVVLTVTVSFKLPTT